MRISEKAHKLAVMRNFQTDTPRSNPERKLAYYSGAIQQMSERLGRFEGKSFLHIASGVGVLTKFLSNMNAKRVVALDIDEAQLEVAKQIGNRETLFHDVTEGLPFKADTFNCLITNHFAFAKYPILDFGSETKGSEALVREGARVLKNDGIFVINAVDGKMLPEQLIATGLKYFHKAEPYLYIYNKHYVPGIVLSAPRKEHF